MNFKIAFPATLAFLALLFLAACEKEAFAPTGEELSLTETLAVDDLAKMGKKDKDKGNSGNGNNDPEPEPEPAVVYTGTYQVVNTIPNQPLYRFSFSEAGDLVLLESDPTLGNYGTDYFGFWDEPFPVANNETVWVQGLGTTIWNFDIVSNNQINVLQTTIVLPYLSGDTTTTVTDLGIYELIP